MCGPKIPEICTDYYERIKKFMTPGKKLFLSTLVSSFDWISDLLVVTVWYNHGHYFWASIMLFFLIFTGIFQVLMLNMLHKMRGCRLFLNLIGLGVYGEVYKFIKLHYFTEQSHDFNGGDLETQRENTATENDFIMARFIKIRGFELITETFPCGALQLYILILYPERYTTVNWISMAASLIGLTYGLISAMVDWPDSAVRAGSRGPTQMAAMAVLTITDFLWRCVFVAKVFTVISSIGIRILIGGLIYLGHFCLYIYTDRQSFRIFASESLCLFILVGFLVALTMCFSNWVNIWRYFCWENPENCNFKRLMTNVNHGYVLFVNCILILLIFMYGEKDDTTIIITIVGSVCFVFASASLWMIERNFDAVRESWKYDAPNDGKLNYEDQEKQNDLICFCW